MLKNFPVIRRTHFAAVTTMLAIGLTAAACGESETPAPTSEMGTVQMALTAVGSDGDEYRLRNATIHVNGPTTAEVDIDEAYGDSEVFAATVDVGEYTITLEDGWTLQRRHGDDYEDVTAELLSPNPTPVEVHRDTTSAVAIIFETVDAEIEFATGDLEVFVGVNHLDCEHGEYVTRSCGANLTGRQFRMCDEGWWQDWSECSTRCDRGYCLFKESETFASATVNKTTETVGFESYATGSPISPDIFATTAGDVFSDNVSFVSIGASTQMFPADSDTPFMGQKYENVTIFGGGGSGDGGIRSSAGAKNFSGFDAIEAIFPSDADVYGATFTVNHNVNGYVIEVHNVDCTVVSMLRVFPSDGTHFIVLGDASHRSIEAASSIVLSPGPDSSVFGTAAWSLNEFAFAR